MLPVAFSSAETPGGADPVHRIFCKKHTVRQSSQATPNERTLFTLGWPPYTTRQGLEELFSRAGHVTAVYLQSSPGPVDTQQQTDTEKQLSPTSGFRVGYVVFSRSSEVNAALRLCEAGSAPPIKCDVALVGLRKWAHEYQSSRPDVASLERWAEVGVALYDRQQEEASRVREKAGQPDEEGWVTVTRKTPRIVVSEL